MLRSFIFAAAQDALGADLAVDLTPQAAHEAVERVIQGLNTPIDPELAHDVETRLLASHPTNHLAA